MATRKTMERPPFADEDEADAFLAFHQVLDSNPSQLTVSAARKAELEAVAGATIRPVKKQISARLSETDLAKLKSRALAKGIPYQTLLASIVHQYVEGTLVDKS